MKQSETQAAVNSSKKLKSTRRSSETKNDSAATILYISILISDKLSQKGIENRQSGLILSLATCLVRKFRARND